MSDASLLGRYASDQDADAFAQLVERYSDLVYGVCLRVTGNRHDAEDAAQECFLSLARHAGRVRSSLPGWLHTTARRAALDAVRRGRKTQGQKEAALNAERNGSTVRWSDLEPHVDAAIEGLPEDLRSAVILHYLQGKSQAEAAEQLGCDRTTVSRRLQRGVEQLRRRLGKAGVTLSVAALIACLGASPAQAAPAGLLASLGKIAVAGPTGAGSVAAAGGFAAMKVAGLAVAAAALITVGVVTLTPSVPTPAPPGPETQPTRPPDRANAAGAAASRSPKTSPKLADDAQWAKAVNGLQMRVTLEGGRVKPGERNKFIIELRNVSDKPLRILKPAMSWGLNRHCYDAAGQRLRGLAMNGEYIAAARITVPAERTVMIPPGGTLRTTHGEHIGDQKVASVRFEYATPGNQPHLKHYWHGSLKAECVLQWPNAPAAQPMDALAWSKPVKGLRMRATLKDGRYEHAGPTVFIIELQNVSDRPLRVLKNPKRRRDLNRMLIDAAGRVIREPQPADVLLVRMPMSPDMTVRLAPGARHQFTYSEELAEPGIAKVRFSFRPVRPLRDDNPELKGYWHARLRDGVLRAECALRGSEAQSARALSLVAPVNVKHPVRRMWDGGTIAMVLVDSRGREYPLCWDGRASQFRHPRRHLFTGATYPTDATHMVDIGGKVERAILVLLRAWADRQADADKQAALLAARNANDVPKKDQDLHRVLIVVRELSARADRPATGAADNAAWSKPVKGLRWRVWLVGGRFEPGKRSVFNIEFQNVSDRPLRILKEPKKRRDLNRVLIDTSGRVIREPQPDDAWPSKIPISPEMTVRLAPGAKHRITYSEHLDPKAARVRFSCNPVGNRNPRLKDYWQGLLRTECVLHARHFHDRRRVLVNRVRQAWTRQQKRLGGAPYDPWVYSSPYFHEYARQPFEWALTYALLDPAHVAKLVRRYEVEIRRQPLETPDGKRLVEKSLVERYAAACEVTRALIESGDEDGLKLIKERTGQGKFAPLLEGLLPLVLTVRDSDVFILERLARNRNWLPAESVADVSRTRPDVALVALEKRAKEPRRPEDLEPPIAMALENVGRYVRTEDGAALAPLFEDVLVRLERELETADKTFLKNRKEGVKYGTAAAVYAHLAIGYHAVGNDKEARRCLKRAWASTKLFPELADRVRFHLVAAEMLVDPESAGDRQRQFLAEMFPAEPGRKPLCTIGGICYFVYAPHLLGPAWEEELKREPAPVRIRTPRYWRLSNARPYLTELYERGEIRKALDFFTRVTRGKLDPQAGVQRIRLAMLNATCLGRALAKLRPQTCGEKRLAAIEAAVRGEFDVETK